MTTYQLDLDTIRDSFQRNGKFSHIISKAKLLPYVTKFYENKVYDFREITAEFARLAFGKTLTGNIGTDELLEKVIGQVRMEGEAQKSQLKQMLTELFVTEENQLHLAHPNYFFYVETKSADNKKIAQFLFDVLCQGKQVEHERMIEASDDVLTRLIFQSLPTLKDKAEKNAASYLNIVPEVTGLFAQDFTWLLQHPKLYIQHFDKLLKYYYFFYVSQFVLACEAMFQEPTTKVRPVFFNLEWESTSQSRTSYIGGWKRLEGPVKRLFSHAICLEFLSHGTEGSPEVYSYPQFYETVRSMSEEDLEKLGRQFDQLMAEYQGNLTDVKWMTFPEHESRYPISVLNKVHTLFRQIDFQFDGYARTKNYTEYKKWFSYFCEEFFLKSRGRLGKTLNLNADYLLFLTKLILKDQRKMRLKTLFDEFENRGILFDRDSQNAIVEYFEAINILEKKSDSGDALYVKSFL